MQVRSHRDAVNTLKYNYSYDAIGRLYLQEILNNSSGEYVGSTQFTYDLRNNVTQIANEMGGRSTVQYYGYSAIEGKPETENYEKDNLPVRYSISDERYIDYTYDSLNRLTGKTLTLASPLSYSYVYKTSQRGSGYTTSLIGRENIGDSFYRYTYDGLGNITNILSGTLSDSDSQSSYRKYTYDALNQLVREDNETTGETYAYIYDDYGNITQKKVYTRTFEDLEGKEPKQVITYSYGVDTDAGWKKLLKSYNGEAITYDAIGNPTTYRGATLDWNERQLKSYDKGNTSVSYKYDSDDLRSSKTFDDGVEETVDPVTKYQYVSGKLMYEDRNGTDINEDRGRFCVFDKSKNFSTSLFKWGAVFLFYKIFFRKNQKIVLLFAFYVTIILERNKGGKNMLLCADREKQKKEFYEILGDFKENQINLMYLYGIPGIGKSVLIESLHQCTKKEYPDIKNAYINFNREGTYFSFFNNIYVQLKTQGVNFYSYELAREYLFQVTGEEKYKIEGKSYGLFTELLTASFELISDPIKKIIANAGVAFGKTVSTRIHSFYNNYMIDQCKDISESKLEDVTKKLGRYLIKDINAYCQNNRCNIFYFVDTFEKCYDKTEFTEESFIKEFILESLYSFWIVGGTSEDIFEKYRNKFTYYYSESLENFGKLEYIKEILNKQYEINDDQVATNIFKLSKGYPAAVELIAQTYNELNKTIKKVSFSDLAEEIDNNDFYKIFFEKYYRRHVIGDDLYVLAFLSCFDSWDYYDYKYYTGIENISNPKIKFEKIKKYVIVKKNSDNSFFIIDVAKRCLLNADEMLTNIIYEQAFDYLCLEINIELEERVNLTNSEKLYSQVFTAIKLGAKILAGEPSFADKYYSWFVSFEQKLSPKMLYELKEKSISYFTQQASEFIMKSTKDDIHSNCRLQVLYDFVWTFCYQRKYTKASEIIEEYEKLSNIICENPKDVRIVKAKYTKAVILQNQGEYEDALQLHKEVLEVRRQNNDRTLIGISLNCVALLYMLINDFENAKKYFDESLEYRSKERGLIGFCTAHSNISKMYFLQALHTNDASYLKFAENELDIALHNLPKDKYEALYRSWKIRYSILKAQELRMADNSIPEDYIGVLSELRDFYDIITNNPQYGMRNHILTTENNIAVLLALMEDKKAFSLLKKCLNDKEIFYDVISNPKNKPCLITRRNLDAYENGNIKDLSFEY